MRFAPRSARTTWVSYLRVSTAGQVEHDLSLPAQRDAIDGYARRAGHVIAREYLEEGRSGRGTNRAVFREMIAEVLRPSSEVAAIVVHHTSRFSRDATEARVIKAKLHRIGVRVISVTQDVHDDPFGNFIESIFECIDQYESEVNGLRVTAAMREAMKQGYCPAAVPPYGFAKRAVEARPGVVRHVLVPDEHEAPIVRELLHLYVAVGGAKATARGLNQRGLWYRGRKHWSKDLVYKVLDEAAIAGTFYWGKRDHRTRQLRPREEWLSLPVEPIVDKTALELALRLRAQREPRRLPGRAAAPDLLLARLVRCGRCGAAYRLETSGKSADAGPYKYRYYNCRTTCRVGKEACAGGRIAADELEHIVIGHIVEVVCTDARAEALAGALGQPPEESERIKPAWRAAVLEGGAITRNYLLHLVDRIDVLDRTVTIIPRVEVPVG
jgi:DNA invertase Pin-like site-specific DNA recombinase